MDQRRELIYWVFLEAQRPDCFTSRPRLIEPTPTAPSQQQDLALMTARDAAMANQLALAPRANGSLPQRPNMPEDPVVPHNGFANQEDAEKAFWHLLRKAGVDSSSTWDNTMRAIITDPLYKSYNSLGERKASWERVSARFRS